MAARLGVVAVSVVALWIGAVVWLSGRPDGAELRAAAIAATQVADSTKAPMGAQGVLHRDEDPARWTVLGQVVDEDGEPVDGGTISTRCLTDDGVAPVPHSTAALDEQGRFVSLGCAGMVCAELAHPSRIRADAWVLQPGRSAVLATRLAGRLFGRVEDQHGQPLADARVGFGATDERDVSALLPVRSRTTSTDAEGEFSVAFVELPPCDPCIEASSGCDDRRAAFDERVRVTAAVDGYAPGRLDVELDGTRGRSPENPIRIVLFAPHDTVIGSLVDPLGEPYPRAKILARSTLRREEQHSTSVDGTTFALESLGEGPYELRALQDGVELARIPAVSPGDEVALRGARPARGPAVAMQVLADGEPVEGARVEGGPFRAADTDVSGTVRVPQGMPGSYRVQVRAPGRPLQVFDVEIPPIGADVAAQADPGDTVVVRVEITS